MCAKAKPYDIIMAVSPLLLTAHLDHALPTAISSHTNSCLIGLLLSLYEGDDDGYGDGNGNTVVHGFDLHTGAVPPKYLEMLQAHRQSARC